VPRDGGNAVRLTRGTGNETDSAFSPDGSEIAFTGEYDGNVDVFVMPAAGGVPKSMTWHPAPDRMLGWTPDGKPADEAYLSGELETAAKGAAGLSLRALPDAAGLDYGGTCHPARGVSGD
jgi:hypothetical protein